MWFKGLGDCPWPRQIIWRCSTLRCKHPTQRYSSSGARSPGHYPLPWVQLATNVDLIILVAFVPFSNSTGRFQRIRAMGHADLSVVCLWSHSARGRHSGRAGDEIARRRYFEKPATDHGDLMIPHRSVDLLLTLVCCFSFQRWCGFRMIRFAARSHSLLCACAANFPYFLPSLVAWKWLEASHPIILPPACNVVGASNFFELSVAVAAIALLFHFCAGGSCHRKFGRCWPRCGDVLLIANKTKGWFFQCRANLSSIICVPAPATIAVRPKRGQVPYVWCLLRSYSARTEVKPQINQDALKCGDETGYNRHVDNSAPSDKLLWKIPSEISWWPYGLQCAVSFLPCTGEDWGIRWPNQQKACVDFEHGLIKAIALKLRI